MARQRIHVVLSSEIVEDIDRRVGRRGRSRFLEQAARLQLTRLKQAEALEIAAGSWAVDEHEELRDGTATYSRHLRHEDERSRE